MLLLDHAYYARHDGRSRCGMARLWLYLAAWLYLALVFRRMLTPVIRALPRLQPRSTSFRLITASQDATQILRVHGRRHRHHGDVVRLRRSTPATSLTSSTWLEGRPARRQNRRQARFREARAQSGTADRQAIETLARAVAVQQQDRARPIEDLSGCWLSFSTASRHTRRVRLPRRRQHPPRAQRRR